MIRGKLNWETLQMACGYTAGRSLEEIAKQCRKSSTTVRKRLAAAGIHIRTPGEAAAQSSMTYPTPGLRRAGKYLSALDREGSPCAIHRACWEARYPLHKGFHVHHIDGDTTNNEMWNLAALAPGIHRTVHAEEARKAVEAYRARDD